MTDTFDRYIMLLFHDYWVLCPYHLLGFDLHSHFDAVVQSFHR